MKLKAIIKIMVDVVMTAALLFLMGYHLWSDFAHEWVGAGLFVLFVAHNVLNLNWYKNLFKGKYTIIRILGVFINMLMLAAMLAQIYSGIVMSGHVFDFIPRIGGTSLARRLHILGSHWGFVLMSLHIGLHWNMFIGMAKKGFKITKPSKIRPAQLFTVGFLIAAYGVYVFVKRDFAAYMLLRSEFVFLDFSESKLLFYLDYLSLMGLGVFIAHYLSKAIRKINGNTRKEGK